MNVTLQGALVGLGLAAFLVIVEYVMANKAAAERGKRYGRKVELDANERRRIRSLAFFSLLLPPGFALFFWTFWG